MIHQRQFFVVSRPKSLEVEWEVFKIQIFWSNIDVPRYKLTKYLSVPRFDKSSDFVNDC